MNLVLLAAAAVLAVEAGDARALGFLSQSFASVNAALQNGAAATQNLMTTIQAAKDDGSSQTGIKSTEAFIPEPNFSSTNIARVPVTPANYQHLVFSEAQQFPADFSLYTTNNVVPPPANTPVQISSQNAPLSREIILDAPSPAPTVVPRMHPLSMGPPAVAKIPKLTSPESFNGTVEFPTPTLPRTRNLQGYENCFSENSSINGVDFNIINSIMSAAGCQAECVKDSRCAFFSHSELMRRCFLYSSATSVTASAGVTSGPRSCASETASNTAAPTSSVPAYLTPKSLDPVTTTAQPSSGAVIDDCFAENKALEGDALRVTSGISSAKECQLLCFYSTGCAFFTFIGNTGACVLYSNATYASPSAGAISGPKSCLEVSTATQAPSQKALTPSVSSAAGGGIFDLLTPITKLLGGQDNGNILAGLGGVLNGNGGKAVEGQGLEGFVSGAANMYGAFANVLAAGDTVMKTLPVADLMKAGYALANNPDVDRPLLPGVMPNKPPAGLADPESTCLSEGMRCCIPRDAAPKYQTAPPLLNGVDDPKCAAQYVSSLDMLCVTTPYDNQCETNVFETDTVRVFRNIMQMPRRTTHDAICECAFSKIPDQLTGVIATTASGKWQYSLSDMEDSALQSEQTRASAAELAKAARAAVSWGDALLGSGTAPTGNSGSAMGFLNSIVSLTEGAAGEGVSGASGGANDFGPGSGSLFSAVKNLRSQADATQRRRLLDVSDASFAPSLSHKSVLSSCNMWPTRCEDLLKELSPEEWLNECAPVQFLRNGVLIHSHFKIRNIRVPSIPDLSALEVDYYSPAPSLVAFSVSCTFNVVEFHDGVEIEPVDYNGHVSSTTESSADSGGSSPFSPSDSGGFPSICSNGGDSTPVSAFSRFTIPLVNVNSATLDVVPALRRYSVIYEFSPEPQISDCGLLKSSESMYGGPIERIFALVL